MMKRKFRRDSKAYVGVFYCVNGLLALIADLLNMLHLYLLILAFLFLVVVAVNLVFALRSKNGFYYIPALHYLVVVLIFWSGFSRGHFFPRILIFGFCLTALALLTVGMSRLLKWRREEILELAALPIEEHTDGFTARPFPSGKSKYSVAELKSFADFLLKHLIAIPVWQENRLLLVISRHVIDLMLKIRRDYERDSWVAFDFGGNVSVKISRPDYLHFQDEYTFDLVCQSLGNLFSEFLILHQQGRQNQIMERLNELRFNPFNGALVGF